MCQLMSGWSIRHSESMCYKGNGRGVKYSEAFFGSTLGLNIDMHFIFSNRRRHWAAFWNCLSLVFFFSFLLRLVFFFSGFYAEYANVRLYS